ncbi:MAG: AsmA family protein [Candidatus Omnitrophota bacterium]
MVLRGFLKFLGGLFTALVILGIILGVIGYFVIRNLDPNTFRAELEKHLTRQTGFRVELGDIKFQWQPQPRLQVAGLKFYHFQNLEKILQSDQVRIDADLTSIWRKHFSMSQVVIQGPEIFFKRSQEGAWNWQVVKEPATSASPAEASRRTESVSVKNLGNVTQGWKFGVGKILVRDATVHFTDETVKPVFRLEIEKLEAEVHQSLGRETFHFTAGGSVFNSTGRNLAAEGDLDLVLQSLDFVLRYSSEKAVFKGRLKMINTLPHSEGTLEVRDLDLETVVPQAYKKGQYVSGILNSDLKLSFEGGNPDMIFRSMNGGGTAAIKNGALKNRNVLREVFQQMSPAVAVTGFLGGEMPPGIAEMMRGPDTDFQRAALALTVNNGKVTFQNFEVVSSDYRLSGKGTYGLLSRRIDLNSALQFSPSISGYFIKKVHELQFLCDRNGCLTVPFQYSGPIAKASVMPDLQYIGNQLLQIEAQKFIDRGMKKLSKFLEKKVGI